MKAIVKLVISFVWSVLKDKKQAVHTNRLRQSPCKTCRFFIKNHHLNCAVQPHLALTKQAFDCTDYRHQEQSDSLMSDFPIFSATVFNPQTQSWHHTDNLLARSESVWVVAPFLCPFSPYSLKPEEVHSESMLTEVKQDE